MDKRPVNDRSDSAFLGSICIASSGLGHVSRGIEAWAQDLALELVHRRQNVLLCKGAGTPNAPFERVLPCLTRCSAAARRVVSMMPRPLGWRLGIGSPYDVEQSTFAVGLLYALRRNHVDILHVQDPRLALLMQRARGLGLVRARTILGHGTEEPYDWLRKIQYVQHLAPWHVEEARRAGIWRETWTAIPNFVDTERFRPGRCPALRADLGIPEDAVVILTVAAIKRAHKRIDYLLTEVQRVRGDGLGEPVWLLVAGGRERETDGVIREGVSRLGDRVRFLVGFPRERMPDVYQLSDMFVLTSLVEMMPIALLEAMASSLPVVVHTHPVLQWAAGPGGAAVDMSTAGNLSRALVSLVKDPVRRRNLGGAGRLHCEAIFGRRHVVDQILAYYALVHGGGAGFGPAEPRRRRA